MGMRFDDISILIIVFLIALVVGISSYFIYGPDNFIEEISEDLVEKEIGIHLDLSPKTGKENSKMVLTFNNF